MWVGFLFFLVNHVGGFFMQSDFHFKVKAKLTKRLLNSAPGTQDYKGAVKGLHQLGLIEKKRYKESLQGVDIRRDFIFLEDPGNSTGYSSLMEKLRFCNQVLEDAREKAKEALERGSEGEAKNHFKRILQVKLAIKEEISLHAS